MRNLKFYHWLIIGFVVMVIIGLGIGYVIDRSKNKSVQGTETQINSPKVETPKTEVKKDEPKVEETVKQESNTPVKGKTITTPQATPTPAAVAVCDEPKKTELTNKYENDISAATQKRDKIYSDANAGYLSAVDRARESCTIIWDPLQRDNCEKRAIDMAGATLNEQRSSADRDFDVTTNYLTFMYGLDMQSAHCSN